MLNPFQRFGRKAENIAAEHLAEHGYRIVRRNYRTRTGEIDLIAKDGPYTVFVEVKARRSETYGHPKEAVSFAKRKKIIKTAQIYLKEMGDAATRTRFDIVSINYHHGTMSIEVIRNAFDAA